jgi:23S rRNA (adenine2030-N6)-methyltransferase
MHYRHSYHAGNFADVFKHVLLCGLAAALNRKDKPWCYVDTHAGAGLYDLSGEGATRTGEWEDGIGRLRGFGEAKEPLATYLRLVRATNPDDKLRHYPGSPLLIQGMVRDGDRLQLCEKVPEVADELKIVLGRDARVGVHLRDGYEAISLLPPSEKRGLVLVDPPFERTDEYEAMGDFAIKSVARFANGVYALWYPIKNRHVANAFLRRMARELTRPVLNFEFETGADHKSDDAPGAIKKTPMTACGVLVINPPFQFEQEMRPILGALAKAMAQGTSAGYSSDWIRKEA